MLTVFVIQGVVFGRTRYFGTKLSLLPVALACIAMHAGAENGGVFGLAAGTFWCLSGGDGAGLLILLCTLCAVAVGYLCDRYLNRNFLSALMMSLLTLIVMQGLLFLFKRYLGQTGEEGWSILLIPGNVLLTYGITWSIQHNINKMQIRAINAALEGRRHGGN